MGSILGADEDWGFRERKDAAFSTKLADLDKQIVEAFLLGVAN